MPAPTPTRRSRSPASWCRCARTTPSAPSTGSPRGRRNPDWSWPAWRRTARPSRTSSSSSWGPTVPDLRLVLVQTRYAILASTRNPRTLVFAVLFPVILLVLFDSIFTSGGAQTVKFQGGRIDVDAYFTGSMAAYAIMLSSFSTVAVVLVTQR